MRTGKIYRHFKASNGQNVTLRALKWEDLDDCVAFINDLVGEKNTEPNLGIMADRKQTREEEAEWLAHQMTGIEGGSIVSVVAEAAGRLAGNSSVTKGSLRRHKVSWIPWDSHLKKASGPRGQFGDDAHTGQGISESGTQNDPTRGLRYQPTRDPCV